MTRRQVVPFVVFVAGLSLSALAQESSARPPVLSDLHRLQMQIFLRDLENAQLRSQLAQRDFDVAKERLSALAQRMQVTGYTLDLQTGTYTKDPE